MAKQLVGHHLLRVRIRKKIFEDLQEISEEASIRTNEHVTVSDLVRSACYNYILMHESLRNLEAMIHNSVLPSSGASAHDFAQRNGPNEIDFDDIDLEDIDFDEMDEESAQEFIENASIHGEEYAIQKYALDQQYNVRENEEALLSSFSDKQDHQIESDIIAALQHVQSNWHHEEDSDQDDELILHMINRANRDIAAAEHGFREHALNTNKTNNKSKKKQKVKQVDRNAHKPSKNTKVPADKAAKDLIVKFS